MNDRLSLTLAFLERQPDAAAKAIAELDAADAAALLDDVAPYLAAQVIERMAGWSAARLVVLLPVEKAAAIVDDMTYRDAVGVLRLVERDRVDRLLQELPIRRARSIRRSLDYPIQFVGAWTDQSIPSFTQDDTVADAVKYLRRRSASVLSHIFLSAKDGTFAGAASVGDVLRATAKTPLGELATSDVRPLSNRDLLSSLLDDERWDVCLVLPVVGPDGKVIGGLMRQTLKRGMAAQSNTTPPARTDSRAMHLFTSYAVVCGGLLRLALPPASGDADTR